MTIYNKMAQKLNKKKKKREEKIGLSNSFHFFGFFCARLLQHKIEVTHECPNLIKIFHTIIVRLFIYYFI